MDSEFWDLLESEEVTQFHAVPNTYDMLRRIGMFEDDFPDLRLLTQAGGKLSRELQAYYADYAAKNGKRFVIMYGQSEATADITWLPPEDALRKPGSVGLVRVERVEEQGQVLEGGREEGLQFVVLLVVDVHLRGAVLQELDVHGSAVFLEPGHEDAALAGVHDGQGLVLLLHGDLAGMVDERRVQIALLQVREGREGLDQRIADGKVFDGVLVVAAFAGGTGEKIAGVVVRNNCHFYVSFTAAPRSPPR